MKSKQQIPCSNCMHWPVMSWGNACSTCMHKAVRCMHQTVTSQADACTYCMGSKVSSLSQIYLYSSYFAIFYFLFLNCFSTFMKSIQRFPNFYLLFGNFSAGWWRSWQVLAARKCKQKIKLWHLSISLIEIKIYRLRESKSALQRHFMHQIILHRFNIS